LKRNEGVEEVSLEEGARGGVDGRQDNLLLRTRKSEREE